MIRKAFGVAVLLAVGLVDAGHHEGRNAGVVTRTACLIRNKYRGLVDLRQVVGLIDAFDPAYLFPVRNPEENDVVFAAHGDLWRIEMGEGEKALRAGDVGERAEERAVVLSFDDLVRVLEGNENRARRHENEREGGLQIELGGQVEKVLEITLVLGVPEDAVAVDAEEVVEVCCVLGAEALGSATEGGEEGGALFARRILGGAGSSAVGSNFARGARGSWGLGVKARGTRVTRGRGRGGGMTGGTG